MLVFPRGGGQFSGAERAQLICGLLGYDAPAFNPLLAALPRVIHLRAADQHDSLLRQLVEGRRGAGKLADFGPQLHAFALG